MQLEKVYDPQQFEPHWAEWWVSSGIFHADAGSPGPVFSLVIPPPNITGSLHMGHMFEHTLIDAVVRWRRMLGDNTLWLPGTDHAGIATQMVVERELARQGLTRQMIGREDFERRVWEWKAQYGDRIKYQLIRVGASCDWSRERFTFDPGLSRAVREVFVSLYEKGLIYRGQYMVNWCPRCNTALSDLEVEHDQVAGNLWHIRYPVNGLEGRYVVVATTRPETMLGDTAVAVNPKDERYRDLHGRTVRLPLMDRDIPVILDELADPEFGTGVVKVTPAHDPNDFEAGKRHDLPHVKVIEETGRMTENAGRFAGLDRFEARRQVVAALDELGLLDKVEAYALSLGKCQRCATPVEPLVSTQWFVKMKPLAEPAIRAVEDGRIRIAPENSERVYFGWMRNIRDWCVSRQLWWGHRIPAWHCKQCGGMIVARQAPEQCSCGSADLEQDPDVLDTWFSSGLWPFSTLGWPDETEDLRTYYPTTLMIMGYEILFFWCARMIMMGLEFMKDVPFRRVYIHGIVRDAEKRKMSKTRGNTVDPMDIVEKYGTDAVRMALLTGAAPGSDVIWTEDRLPSARAFANKIWNAARFLFLKMEESGVQPWIPEQRASYTPETVEPGGEARIEDRWIFSRLNHCAGEVNRALDQYRYHEAAQTLWHFAWHEYCDWYVELKKLRFRKNSGLDADWRNALTAFEAMLRLLHPVTPFLTEELWQRLAANTRARPASVALARFPEYREEAADPAAESEMDMVQSIITAARHLRADMGLNPKQQVEAVLFAADEASEIGGRNLASIEKLATIRLELRAGHAPADVQGVKRSTTAFDLVLRAPVEQAEAQRKRLAREIEQLEKVIANSKRQLADEKFLSRAPEPVVNSIRQKLVEYQAQLGKSRSALETLAR